MLGRVLAMNLNKKAGDRLDVAGETVRGRGDLREREPVRERRADRCPLKTLQKMMGREGQATGFVITAKDSDREYVDSLRKRIEAAIPDVAATPARDHVHGDTQIRLAKAMAWTTGGGRPVPGLRRHAQHDADVDLRAHPRDRHPAGRRLAAPPRAGARAGRVPGRSPWPGRSSGSVLAVVGLRAVTLSPSARGFIEPNLPPEVLVLALVMGVGLSLLGGLYPAARAAALDPTEALRYE